MIAFFQPKSWTHLAHLGLMLGPDRLFRRYVPPNGYVNPSAMTAVVDANLRTVLHLDGNQADAVSGYAAATLLNERMPTYFIGNDFAEAVAMTTLPEDMLFSEINWPLPAAVFCLPVDFSKRVFGHEIPFLSYSVIKAGKAQLFGKPLGVDIESIADCWVMKAPVFVNGSLVSYYQKRPMWDKLASTHDDVEIQDGCAVSQDDLQPPADEKALLTKMCAFVLKLVLLMGAEPSLTESGGIMRPGKEKRGKKVAELWHPNFLGRRYRHSAPPQGGTHASPRLHRRRGHLHTFLVGKGRTTKSVKWLKPVWVNL